MDDKFELLEHLGSGSLGSVYRAKRLADDTLVAVKVRHQTNAPQTEIERMQREAHLAALVSHPHIVTMYSHGVTTEGISYLEMELLEGPSLAQELTAHGPFSLERTLILLRPVALALAAAHSRGLIHRDLKPSNIILHHPQDGGEAVKVVDFGMAKLDRVEPIEGQLNSGGWVVGTPEYMSPEQCLGHQADGRTDVYSFGVVLFELLTGTLPFEAPTVSGVLLKQISEHPPYLRRLRPELPASIEAFLLRLLSKIPDGRPSGMIEALEELESICRKWAVDRQDRFSQPTLMEPLDEVTAQAVNPVVAAQMHAYSARNAPTLVATLVDIPNAWELDERETLSGCFLRAAFCRRLQEAMIAKPAISPELPQGCLVMLELVGWEAWRTKAKVDDVEHALRYTGQLLRRIFGTSTLLGRYSESRWLVALALQDSAPRPSREPRSAKLRLTNTARKKILEFHRAVQAHPILGGSAHLVVTGGGALYGQGDVAEGLLPIALQRLLRARKNDRDLLIIGEDLDQLDSKKTPDMSAPSTGVPQEVIQRLNSSEECVTTTSQLRRFVGRTTEFEKIRTAFYKNVHGASYPAWILGEPGVGKTRFLDYIHEQFIAKDVFFLTGCFQEIGGEEPLRVLVDHLNGVLKNLAEENPENIPLTFGTLGDRIHSDFLGSSSDSGTILARASGFRPGTAETQKVEQFEYLTRIYCLLARLRPVMLCLDDLQWASPVTLEFISYLLRSSMQERVFVLCAFRQPDIEITDHPVRLWLRRTQRQFPGETLTLPPFTLTETRTFIETQLDGASVAELLVHRLYSETGGNAFYCAELVAALLGEGRISWNRSGWQLGGTEPLPVPLPVQEQVEALLAQMEPEYVAVYSQAALIGEVFSFELLSRITELNEKKLLDVLEYGIERGLLSEDDSVQDGYRFKQVMVRRVLSENLSQRRKRHLHKTLTETIATQYADRQFWLGHLAGHAFASENWSLACATALRAGRVAQRSKNALALLHAQRLYEIAYQSIKKMEQSDWRGENGNGGAASLSVEDARQQVRFHLDYSTLFESLGMLDLAATQVAEAHDTAEKLGADDLLAQTAVARGRLYEDQGDTTSALNAGYQGLAVLLQVEDTGGIIVALLLLGSLNQRIGRYQTALDQFSQALERAREQHNSNAEAQALCGLAATYHAQGNFAQALQTAKQSISLSQRERGQREIFSLQQAKNVLGLVYLDMGLYGHAGDFFRAALHSSQAGGYRFSEATLLASLGRLHLENAVQMFKGRFPTGSFTASNQPLVNDVALAGEYIKQAQRLAIHLGDAETQARALITSGYFSARQGKLPLALETLQQTLPLVRDMQRPVLEAQAYVAIGDIRYQLGQFAVGMYDRALAIAETIGHRLTIWQALFGLAVIAKNQGEPEKLNQYLTRGYEILAQMSEDLPPDLQATAFQREQTSLLRLGEG